MFCTTGCAGLALAAAHALQAERPRLLLVELHGAAALVAPGVEGLELLLKQRFALGLDQRVHRGILLGGRLGRAGAVDQRQNTRGCQQGSSERPEHRVHSGILTGRRPSPAQAHGQRRVRLRPERLSKTGLWRDPRGRATAGPGPEPRAGRTGSARLELEAEGRVPRMAP